MIVIRYQRLEIENMVKDIMKELMNCFRFRATTTLNWEISNPQQISENVSH